MRIPWLGHEFTRAGLGLLAVVALAAIPLSHWGFYTPTALAGAVGALGLSLAACLLPLEPGVQRPVHSRLITAMFGAVALFLSGAAVCCTDLFYGGPPGAVCLMRLAGGAGFVVNASLLIRSLAVAARPDRSLAVAARPDRSLAVAARPLLVLFLAGAFLRVCAVQAVPDPAVDVFVALRDAPGQLLQGRNPYTASYDWPYESPPEPYDVPPFYLPLPFLLALPWRAAGLDVRYANVACDLLAAGILFAAGKVRGRPVAGAFAAGTYLNLPRVPFLMEQAWYEPMIAALLGSGLLLAERGWRLGYFFLGLAVSGKQYGVVILLPLAKALLEGWRLLVTGLGLAVGLVLLPFLLWNPTAFLRVVLFAHLERPVKYVSVTLRSGLHNELGMQWPGWFWLALAGVLVAVVTWRTPRQPVASALWIATALLAFFLCHSQAFVNYFYLCQYLLLLGAVGTLPPPHPNLPPRP